jgi:16S rRNA (guanine527-N7)-methyltransferase
MDTTALEPTLRQGIEELRLVLSDHQVQNLLEYLKLLHQWNRAYNLTAITAPAEMVAMHLLDSLAIVPHLEGETFIDVGTGPGLPGIPLAIALPGKTFSLLDSNGKRTRFLFQVRTSLGLCNVSEIHARTENYCHEQGFDGVLSRAFTSVPDMVAKTRHLLKPGGHFYAMKGRKPDKELSDLPKPFNVSSCYRLSVPGVDGERHLVSISNPC